MSIYTLFYCYKAEGLSMLCLGYKTSETVDIYTTDMKSKKIGTGEGKELGTRRHALQKESGYDNNTRTED